MYRRNSKIVGNSAKMLKSTCKRTKLIIYVKKIIFGFLTLNVWEKFENCWKQRKNAQKHLKMNKIIIYVKKIIFGFLTLNVWEKLEKCRKPAHKCSKALENELN